MSGAFPDTVANRLIDDRTRIALHINYDSYPTIQAPVDLALELMGKVRERVARHQMFVGAVSETQYLDYYRESFRELGVVECNPIHLLKMCGEQLNLAGESAKWILKNDPDSFTNLPDVPVKAIKDLRDSNTHYFDNLHMEQYLDVLSKNKPSYKPTIDASLKEVEHIMRTNRWALIDDGYSPKFNNEARKRFQSLRDLQKWFNSMDPTTCLDFANKSPHCAAFLLAITDYCSLAYCLEQHNEANSIPISAVAKSLRIEEYDALCRIAYEVKRAEIRDISYHLSATSLFFMHANPEIYQDYAYKRLQQCRNDLSHFDDVRLGKAPTLTELSTLCSRLRAKVGDVFPIDMGEEEHVYANKLDTASWKLLDRYFKISLGEALFDSEKLKVINHFADWLLKDFPNKGPLQDAALIAAGRAIEKLPIKDGKKTLDCIRSNKKKLLDPLQPVVLPKDHSHVVKQSVKEFFSDMQKAISITQSTSTARA